MTLDDLITHNKTEFKANDPFMTIGEGGEVVTIFRVAAVLGREGTHLTVCVPVRVDGTRQIEWELGPLDEAENPRGIIPASNAEDVDSHIQAVPVIAAKLGYTLYRIELQA